MLTRQEPNRSLRPWTWGGSPSRALRRWGQMIRDITTTSGRLAAISLLPRASAKKKTARMTRRAPRQSFLKSKGQLSQAKRKKIAVNRSRRPDM